MEQIDEPPWNMKHSADPGNDYSLPTIEIGFREANRSAKDYCRNLSKSDANSCLDIINETLTCNNKETLSYLIMEIGSMVEADYSACLFASIESSSENLKIMLLDAVSPVGWLKIYAEKKLYLVDPIVAENFRHFPLQYWPETYQKSPPPGEFRALAEDFGLDNGISWGLRKGGARGGTLFSFSGPHVSNGAHCADILGLTLPHIHRAICELDQKGPQPEPVSPLSVRELEVLRWVGAGKSSWEIGVILKITERTVKFHIMNALNKLDSVTRSQALAKALTMGLLELG